MAISNGWKVSVCGLITHDDHIVLVKQKDGIDHRLSGYWRLPTGKVEEKESEVSAFFREMKEETGLEIKLKKENPFDIKRVPKSKITIIYFDCSPADPNCKPIPDKTADVSEAVFAPITAVPNYLRRCALCDLTKKICDRFDIDPSLYHLEF